MFFGGIVIYLGSFFEESFLIYFNRLQKIIKILFFLNS
ncbi:putative membrane protein [Candidatus Phytoplasma solani]